MADTIKVAAIALDIVWANPPKNIKAVEKHLQKIPADTDLVVLPELFTTGFIQDVDLLHSLSEKAEGPTLTKLKEWAAQGNYAIAGSYSAQEDGKVFNRGFFITPEGETTFYDKRHLFKPSAENELYAAGRKWLQVVNFRGWKIALMICYDLRFPVWARNAGHAYDMMLVPANWPTARGYAWSHLLIARAIENQAVYVGCDRGGQDDYGLYDGLSMIVDAMGQPIGESIGDSIMVATPSLESVQKSRRKLPTIDSADDFNLIDIE